MSEDDFGLPPLSKVVKFQNQDFDQIRTRCAQEDFIWEDPKFLPDIGDLEWKRPWEIASVPCLIQQEPVYDIRQGLLNDSCMIAAMQALTTRPVLMSWVVPRDQDCIQNNWGVVHFKIWQLGTWYDICVDDRLPTKEGKLVYTHSSNEGEFWCALLEKACAKLHGSFAALEIGNTTDAMVDFSGGISEKIFLDPPPLGLGFFLLEAYQKKVLLCGTTNKDNLNSLKSLNKLGDNHDYTITGVKYVRTLSFSITLVRLRNPWAVHEWTGPWSDKCSEWHSVSEDIKLGEMGLSAETDGEFWMPEVNFEEHFSSLSICHLSPDTVMNSGTTLAPLKKWTANSFKGEWVRGVSAGGMSFNTIHKNPQYRITLIDDSDTEGSGGSNTDGLCSIVISLLQKNKSRHKEWKTGIKIFQLEDPTLLPSLLGPTFFAGNPINLGWGFQVNGREIVSRQKLLPGEYCIIPCTENKDEEGQFLLRVFAEGGVMEEVDQRTSLKIINDPDVAATLMAHHVIPVEVESKTDEDVVSSFSKVAGKDLTIDWIGLKKILDSHIGDIHSDSPLTHLFSYLVHRTRLFFGFFFSISPPPQSIDAGKIIFSKEMCRNLISFMDEENSGRIGFDEFDNIWSHICYWKLIYRLYSTRKKGFMEAVDLREALGKVGFTLSTRALAILTHKYADEEGHLAFDDFIMCIISLHLNMKNFKTMDKEDTGQVLISLEEWVAKTFYV